MVAIEDIDEAVERIKRAKIKIICPPSWVDRVGAQIHAEGLADRVEVIGSEHIEFDRCYVLNPVI